MVLGIKKGEDTGTKEHLTERKFYENSWNIFYEDNALGLLKVEDILRIYFTERTF